MTSGTVKYEFDLTFRGRELHLTIEADYKATPYDSGCISSTPENDYPPEGGDIEEVTFTPLAAEEADGTKWTDEELKDPELLKAIEQWHEATPEPIAEAVLTAVMEKRCDEPSDY
jgi:hypothetical protein